MPSTIIKPPIPVVDIFAGPGGLGEGFARFPYTQPEHSRFQIRLSIEKDARAHETLLLRSFKRQFRHKRVPSAYYKLLREFPTNCSQKVRDQYFAQMLKTFAGKFPDEFGKADDEALCAVLGEEKDRTVIEAAVAKAVGRERNWVLLGGPPCQAYSLVGRARNKGIKDYRPEQDHRHFLYREYLKVIGEHLPTVFVMENVKGLLSATVGNERIFEQMIRDLREPRKNLVKPKNCPKGIKPTYRLFALGPQSEQHQQQMFNEPRDSELTDFVVRMEEFGVPQARHRLIILGVREDVRLNGPPKKLEPSAPVKAIDVLEDLPRLRSGLSRESDNQSSWKRRVIEVSKSEWFKELKNGHADVKRLIRESLAKLRHESLGRGCEWADCQPKSKHLGKWYYDAKISGVFNHDTRGHEFEDLHRYLFASCFAKAKGKSPLLIDFPIALLPKHKNVQAAVKSGSLAEVPFQDRFRVQFAGRPSTTVTSHISKDGHYYIHHDPSQCRSLTVREAARLQTFPDNYFFCGPRTSQYTQVGNAVPPYLAHQIAGIVGKVLSEAGIG